MVWQFYPRIASIAIYHDSHDYTELAMVYICDKHSLIFTLTIYSSYKIALNIIITS